MSTNPTRKDLIKAIMTNPSLNDDEKSLLVEEFINEINKEYPDLKYHATKQDISEVELKLTKEIDNVRLEIEEVRREIKELDNKASKEREKIRLEIKELDLKLSNKISDTKADLIKWVIGLFTLQTGLLVGAIFTMFKLFKGLH